MKLKKDFQFGSRQSKVCWLQPLWAVWWPCLLDSVPFAAFVKTAASIMQPVDSSTLPSSSLLQACVHLQQRLTLTKMPKWSTSWLISWTLDGVSGQELAPLAWLSSAPFFILALAEVTCTELFECDDCLHFPPNNNNNTNKKKSYDDIYHIKSITTTFPSHIFTFWMLLFFIFLSAAISLTFKSIIFSWIMKVYSLKSHSQKHLMIIK